jgi:hypothetical protein
MEPAINESRRLKKHLMEKLGITGKQYQKMRKRINREKNNARRQNKAD